MRIKWTYFLLIFLFLMQYSISAVLPQYGGTYRLAISGQPMTFDPARVSTPTERWIIINLYDRLVELDNQNQVVPALAESWSASPDGLLWTFKLRGSAKFHTGKPVTPEAVKFSIERLVNPAMRAPKSWLFSSVSGYREYIAGQANQISGINLINKTTVQVRLVNPNPNLLFALASPAASIVSPEDIANIDRQPIGSGAFTFAEQTGKYIRVTANPDYWEGRPYLDELRFIFSDNPTSDLLEFELGNLDECFVPEEEFHRLAENPQWKPLLTPVEFPNLAYLGFNLTKSPMTDIKFRQALRYAIDRQGILEIALNNHGTIANSLLSDFESDSDSFAYSISSAQPLLRAFPKRMLTLLVNKSEPGTHHIAQRIQVNLLEAGYPIQVEKLATAEYIRRIREGNYDLFYCHYVADNPDPEIILRSLFIEKNFGIEGNQTFYYHPQLESTLDFAKTALDETDRNNQLLRVNKIIQQDIPILSLFRVTPYLIRQPQVQNLDRSAYQYRSFKNIWLNKLQQQPAMAKSTAEGQKGKTE
ncbi:MAG: ABC transporter substrate-binding protein [bacterium]|nr:ABC transporter substrate-binding protein [bacterium]